MRTKKKGSPRAFLRLPNYLYHVLYESQKYAQINPYLQLKEEFSKKYFYVASIYAHSKDMKYFLI